MNVLTTRKFLVYKINQLSKEMVELREALKVLDAEVNELRRPPKVQATNQAQAYSCSPQSNGLSVISHETFDDPRHLKGNKS